jgi:hypothetical protein
MPETLLKELFEVAANITSPLGAAVSVGVLVVAVVLLARRKAPWPAWTLLALVIAVIAFLAAVPFIFVDPLYRLRVTIKEADGRTARIDRDHVTLDTPHEKAPTDDGWRFEIFASQLPASRSVVLRAEQPDRGTVAEQAVKLADDHNVRLTLTLEPLEHAKIAGIVVDRADNRSIAGATVAVVGSPAAPFVTRGGGGFELDAGRSAGQLVLLHTEAPGYMPDHQNYTAGSQNVTIALEKAKTPRRPGR